MPVARSPKPPLVRLLAVLLAATWVVVACGGDSESGSGADGAGDESADVQTYSGYVVDPPNEAGDITVPRADGTGEFAMKAPEGGLDLVYFGYTFCPDVCPTTMADVRKVLAALPAEEAERIQVAMVTVDPARDTPEVLTGYVQNFVDDGVALRTDDDATLRAAADAFGADYEVRTNDEGEIEVSHTGELYAVDQTGTVVMQWPFGTSYEAITRDIRSLLAEAGSTA